MVVSKVERLTILSMVEGQPIYLLRNCNAKEHGDVFFCYAPGPDLACYTYV